jgi:hypothetical protein
VPQLVPEGARDIAERMRVVESFPKVVKWVRTSAAVLQK